MQILIVICIFMLHVCGFCLLLFFIISTLNNFFIVELCFYDQIRIG